MIEAHLEDAIVQRSVKGDREAFEQLVQLYERRVYTMALRMVGSPEDAYDLSQETFLRVYRSIRTFRGEAKFSTWIYKIVSNLCITFLRRKNRIRQIPLEQEADGGFEISLPDDRFNPELVLERVEISRTIEQALKTLSEEHRAIFILRELNGLSYAEIGEILSLEEGTVKSRLFRAREKLRVYLIEHGNISGPHSSNTAKGGDGT